MNILRFIHFVDNESEVPCDPAQHDCLVKIHSALDELQRQFRQNYIPAREVSIDQTMVKFKGRKFFRQFLPSKPIRFGFKLFTVAESHTGYICDFEVYTGRKGEAELNQTRNVVLRLMGPLEGKGYWLFTDNFYTSPELYFSLRERGIQACCTVRPNRKDLPKEIMDHKLPLVKNLQRGECTFRQKGELVALTWKDKKPVHLISTIPIGNRMDTATRKVKVDGAWQAKEFGCPMGIKLYNASMGGVDLANQRIASYKNISKLVLGI
ncbi:piggyBac transposable element-derived protein 4-like [Orbicella faveolata]|uniref:piggyBac transposable element-derived protein 4-like n=1 Tax=Orbicella faveolata TaxID=48498 RepID=UPI0009E20C32|nr:piggyBac transposable element-derived protein 4-like [Orbicella faveolata]